MPKVSVIIPTCNRAQFLRAAIESVRTQTFQDFEIIVVDDASTDETPETVSTLADGRVRYFRQEIRRGQGATRNLGIMQAEGDYIALLDDDDEWLPTKIEKQVDLLDALPADVGLIYSGFVKVDASTNQKIAEITPKLRGNVFHSICEGNWIGTSTVLLRRRCVDGVGYFDEELASGEDYDMWIRISKTFSVDYIDEPLVLYRVHAESLSKNCEAIIRGVEALLRKHSPYFALNSKNYSRRYSNLGVNYCLSGDTKKGRRALSQAIRLYPFDARHYYDFFLSLLGPGIFRGLKGPRSGRFPLTPDRV